MGSGDEIETGRTTTGESTTVILGAIPSEGDVDFNGVVILQVAPEPGNLHPSITLDGIYGFGSNGGGFTGAAPGGTGVVGFGGPNHGTGVSGIGGGIDGTGGIGVQGTGGSVFAIPSFDPNQPPGAGVVAVGGRSDDANNFPRLSHGAGVIAIAGAGKGPIPLLADTGSVGAYAQGADATISTVNIDNVDTVVGPLAPGPGVLGRGGAPNPPEGPVASGVIGLAGNVAIPLIAESGNAGVYGAGPMGVFGHGSVGVRGQSESGPGIFGMADTGRGGVFTSARSAQVQLVPRKVPAPFPAPVPVTPTAIPSKNEVVHLPKAGQGGDLLALTDDKGLCTLWFCVMGEQGGPAQWAQVLLGAAFSGNA